MCLKFVRCFESNRAGMTFPFKCGYVKTSFKTDICLTISWPMFPSCGTKQRATYKIYPQTKLRLFSGSKIPQARCSCNPKWSVPCVREDKGGHKAQERPEVCAVKQTPQLQQGSPSAGPLLHRNLAICPNSGRKKVSDKDAERSGNFKIQIWVSCSTGKHRHTKEIWKIIFLIFFWKLNPG